MKRFANDAGVFGAIGGVIGELRDSNIDAYVMLRREALLGLTVCVRCISR